MKKNQVIFLIVILCLLCSGFTYVDTFPNEQDKEILWLETGTNYQQHLNSLYSNLSRITLDFVGDCPNIMVTLYDDAKKRVMQSQDVAKTGSPFVMDVHENSMSNNVLIIINNSNPDLVSRRYLNYNTSTFHNLTQDPALEKNFVGTPPIRYWEYQIERKKTACGMQTTKKKDELLSDPMEKRTVAYGFPYHFIHEDIPDEQKYLAVKVEYDTPTIKRVMESLQFYKYVNRPYLKYIHFIDKYRFVLTFYFLIAMFLITGIMYFPILDILKSLIIIIVIYYLVTTMISWFIDIPIINLLPILISSLMVYFFIFISKKKGGK